MGGELEVAFVFSVEGDYRLEEPQRGTVFTYDARELTVDILVPSEKGMRRAGIPPAGPDADHVHGYFGPGLIAEGLQRLAAGTAWSASLLDRAAVSWERVGNSESGDYQLTVVLDEQTLLPLRVARVWPASELYPEGQTQSWEVTELKTVEVPRTVFSQGFEPGNLAGSDQGFRPVTLEEAVAASGYEPPLPAWLPAEFVLTEVAYSEKPAWDAFNPQADREPSRQVVVAVYHRGLQSVTVTTRLADEPVERFTIDPYCTEGCEPPERYESSSGATFQVVGWGWRPPHAWGIAGDLVITVDGDITVPDLKAILDSLPLKADSSG